VTGTRPMPDGTYRHIVEQQLPCVAQILTERHIEFFEGVALHAGVWGEILKAKDANDRRLIAGGAKLMLSTDGGLFGPTASSNPLLGGFLAAPDLLWHLGSSHMLWLQAAVDRGMSTMDALLSVTRNIAEGYQMRTSSGRSRPGSAPTSASSTETRWPTSRTTGVSRTSSRTAISSTATGSPSTRS
jgi:hypothetical protein